MNKPTDNKFEEVKARGELLYSTIKEVFCPYFQEKIPFNSKGMEHLKFISRERVRLRSDQYMRFRLLYLAPKILGMTRTLQGLSRFQLFERVRMHNRIETKMVPVIHYVFIAIVDDFRVKIIVKQMDDGEKYFWSIIPYWRVDPHDKTRLFLTGDKDQD